MGGDPVTAETCRCGATVVSGQGGWLEPTMTSAGPEAPYFPHTEQRCRVYRAANGEGSR